MHVENINELQILTSIVDLKIVLFVNHFKVVIAAIFVMGAIDAYEILHLYKKNLNLG